MFGELALLVVAGLVGPLLAAGSRQIAPAVVGELAAGAILGRSGLGLVDPGAGVLPVFSGLGFAMLMLMAGTKVSPTSGAFRSGLAQGSVALGVAALLALPLGWAISSALGVGAPVTLVVLLVGSSAAVAFPIIEERRLAGPDVPFLMTWIALVDIVCVVLLPLTLLGTRQITDAIAGIALIIALTIGFLWAAELGLRRRVTGVLIRESQERGWLLQLRLSVLLLFVLAAVAEGTGASTLVAGFAAGIVLNRLREPDRLALQLAGLATGFFVPLFFVLLGASLDLRGLVQDPSAIGLAAAMALGGIAIHLVAAFVAHRPQWLATGLAASAQLGLPAAAASLGLAAHVLAPSAAAALVAGACLTLIPATLGADMLARSESVPASR